MQIVFNGNTYIKETLLSLTGFGHREVINKNDLIYLDGCETSSQITVAYKHEGKSYVLVKSSESSIGGEVECVFISKHVLKKAMVVKPPQQSRLHPGLQQYTKRIDINAHLGKNHDRDDYELEPIVKLPQNTGADKAKAALDVLNKANNRSGQNNQISLTDKTRKALSVLEETMKREQVKEA